MASSVRAISNHYETLQVSPAATTDEIVQAFASHMRTARLRPDITIGRLAQLSVAYETLRDPVKRRTYDASIDLKPEPAAALEGASIFIGAPVINRLNRIAERSPSPPAPKEVASSPAVTAEPRVAAFIAASLREPADQADEANSDAASQAEASPHSQVKAEAPSPPVGEKLEIEEDPQKLDRLVNAIYRLTELERVLSGRPLPGQLKPTSRPAPRPDSEPLR